MPDTAPAKIEFVPDTVHKRDEFSETISGHAAHDPDLKLAMRKLSGLPWWSRWLAWRLARREITGLEAVQGIKGTPVLYEVNADGILRDWTAGTPLHLAKPSDRAWYDDAARLLRDMRRRGVTHNDLNKPQNWLMTPDGRAAVIDFQLARVSPRKGKLYRIRAYEDLRHLQKQKRRFAPDLLTPKGWQMVEQRSIPSQIWAATGKQVYNFITRRLLNWSDGEGTASRMDSDGPAIQSALESASGVRAVALCTYPLPSQGVGLYGFVETDLNQAATRALLPETRIEKIQAVTSLPRDGAGAIRQEPLDLIAMNRLDELEVLLAREPDLRASVAPIVKERQNLTDRYR
ncbi:MAG: phosphotransferase [Rhodobacteraceae bacterium]|nr:phosphotransferase [Paracoccaceae bacterium]